MLHGIQKSEIENHGNECESRKDVHVEIQ